MSIKGYTYAKAVSISSYYATIFEFIDMMWPPGTKMVSGLLPLKISTLLPALITAISILKTLNFMAASAVSTIYLTD